MNEVSSSGTMVQDGEIVTAHAGGSLGGAVKVDEGEVPVASASSYSAKMTSADPDFVSVLEQDNYALTIGVVNAVAYTDGTSTQIEGSDLAVGDALGYSALGNVALDVGNKYADYRDAVLSGDFGGFDPIDGPFIDPEYAYYLNPIGLGLASELGSTSDNFAIVTQLGGDANLSAVVVDGVGTVDQSVVNTSIMKGSIFSGITSTFTPVTPG